VRPIARPRQGSAGAGRKNPFKMIRKCAEVKPGTEQAHLMTCNHRFVATRNCVCVPPRRSRQSWCFSLPLFSRHSARTIIARAFTRLLIGYAISALSL
jgi:hypothetical protein